MNKFKLMTKAALLAGLALGNTAQADLLYNILDLGTLGGNDIHMGFGKVDINASGQVTGLSPLADGSYHAFSSPTAMAL